jgi:hypothetical protein
LADREMGIAPNRETRDSHPRGDPQTS